MQGHHNEIVYKGRVGAVRVNQMRQMRKALPGLSSDVLMHPIDKGIKQCENAECTTLRVRGSHFCFDHDGTKCHHPKPIPS